MNCKRTEEIILTDYIDGNLKGEALREVEAHLESCERCRKLADEALSAGKIFSAAGKEEPPAGVWHRIKAEIGARREAPQPALFERVLDPLRYFFTQTLRPAVAMAAAAALILFILTATRIIPNMTALTGDTARDDIMAMASLDEGQDEPEYDFGTVTEQYFL